MLNLIVIILLTVGFAVPAWAQASGLPKPDEPAFPGQNLCHVKLPDGDRNSTEFVDWKPQEHLAWNKICLGENANLSAFADAANGISPYVCNVENAEGWPAHSVLSNRFLQTVTTHPRYSKLIGKNGVSIQCARFEEEIDLSGALLGWPLNLSRALFARGMLLQGLETRGDMSLSGSRFKGTLTAFELKVDRTLYLRDGATFQDVNLVGAIIGGNLETDGATFKGLF